MSVKEQDRPTLSEDDFPLPKRPRLETRTPEEIEETRKRIFALSRPPRPLPPGKTVWDMIAGQWPGDETDEEFQAMLDSLKS